MAQLSLPLAVGILALCTPGAAKSSETIVYTYDAKGRLVKAERSGTSNSGVKYEYSHDHANNRRNLKVTGSSNSPPP